MKGIVEIYSGFGTADQKLLYTENNLIVDGASETICDMFTIASGNVSSVPGLLDASNYTVNAMSFGKGSESYRKNAHFYPVAPSSFNDETDTYYGYVNQVKEDHRVRAVSLVNENIAHSASSYDPRRDPGKAPSPTDRQLEPDTRTAIDIVSGQYHHMGPSASMGGRAHQYGHNLNKLFCGTNPNLFSYTRSPLDQPGSAAGAEPFLQGGPYWSSSTSNPMTLTTSSVHSGPFYGTSSLLVSGEDGNVTLRQEVSAVTVDTRAYFHHNLDHTLSFYVKKPSVNKPQYLYLNIRAMNSDRSTTVENHIARFSIGLSSIDWDSAYTTDANGAKGFVTDVGNDWYRVECRLERLGTGSAVNGNYIRSIWYFNSTGDNCALHQYGWQLEERYGASKYQEVRAELPTFDEGGRDGDIFLGCFPDSTGTAFGIVSSVSGLSLGSTADSMLVSGIYPSNQVGRAQPQEPFFNSSAIRSMDSNGFIRTYIPDAYPFDGAVEDLQTKATSGVIVSAISTGEWDSEQIAYICTISSGDLGLANMYGGIFKCGLWSIDLERTMRGLGHDETFSAPAQPPFKFCAGSNRIVYKLFAEKSMSINLGMIKDDTLDPPNSGALNYNPVTIVWRLSFS